MFFLLEKTGKLETQFIFTFCISAFEKVDPIFVKFCSFFSNPFAEKKRKKKKIENFFHRRHEHGQRRPPRSDAAYAVSAYAGCNSGGGTRGRARQAQRLRGSAGDARALDGGRVV
jgi:hypothetical protein